MTSQLLATALLALHQIRLAQTMYLTTDITEELALVWCFADGVDKDAIEASLAANIDAQINPVTASWSALVMPTLKVDDTEYEIDDMSPEQQKMVRRVSELNDQIEEIRFVITGYINTIKSDLDNKENEE